MSQDQQTRKGGRREGAGRPQLDETGKAERSSISMPPGMLAEIKALDPSGREFVSRGVRFLLEFYKEHKWAEIPPPDLDQWKVDGVKAPPPWIAEAPAHQVEPAHWAWYHKNAWRLLATAARVESNRAKLLIVAVELFNVTHPVKMPPLPVWIGQGHDVDPRPVPEWISEAEEEQANAATWAWNNDREWRLYATIAETDDLRDLLLAQAVKRWRPLFYTPPNPEVATQ